MNPFIQFLLGIPERLGEVTKLNPGTPAIFPNSAGIALIVIVASIVVILGYGYISRIRR